MRPVHLIGLFLWRGGLLLAAAAVLFEAARWALRFVQPPLEIEIGLGLLLAGLGLVLLSLILERARDGRAEGAHLE